MGIGISHRGLLGIWSAAGALVIALAVAPVAGAAAIPPYGTHDAGGFRNVLPPGEAGTDNVAQLAQFDQTQGMLPVGDHTRTDPNAPDFFAGWWGYVSKDLRDLLGPEPRGGWSKVYCGGGSPAKCREALRSSLRQALKVTPAALYGHGDCADDPQPSCFDQNRSIITSAISIPPAPFQNRPTFQQTVSVTKNLP